MHISSVTIAEFAAPRFRASVAAVTSAAALFAAIHAYDDSLRNFAATLVTSPEAVTLANDVIRFGGLMICLLLATWVYRLIRQHEFDTAQTDSAVQLHDMIPAAPPHALLITDDYGRIVWANHAFSRLTGYGFEESLGRHYSSLLKAGPHDQEFYKSLLRTLSAGLSWHGEIINRRKDGTLFHDELTITPLSGTDSGKADAHQSDCSAQRQTVDLPAYYDPLNRLPRHDLMLERLQQVLDLCAYDGSHAALMLIDLEPYTPSGKQPDHNADEHFMTAAAKRIDACMHTGGMAARYGEHEFAVILSLNSDEDDAYLEAIKIARNILIAMTPAEHPTAEQNGATNISPGQGCYIGIAVSSPPSAAPEELLKRAAAAMYQARAVGRSGIRFYRRTVHTSMAAH